MTSTNETKKTMKTIKRSEILSLPEARRLPALCANELRQYPYSSAYAWIGEDGVACQIAYSPAEFGEDDPDDPGQWVTVQMDEPLTGPTQEELEAARWLSIMGVDAFYEGESF